MKPYLRSFPVMLGLYCLCSMVLQASELKQTEVSELDMQQSLNFLQKHMSNSDKREISEEYLEKNTRFALKARMEFSWAEKVPEDIFLNDVLPYASLDERRDDWREDFYQRFKKIVRPAKTQKEAITLINQAIKDELGVAYSTARKKANQSPYESIESGIASCSGLSILLTNAFRSVGIPARIAGTPSWTTKRGNHNWVEVWTVEDKSWHFTEYYPDAKGLDHAWFSVDAAKADAGNPIHRIYATSWKSTQDHFPMVWDMQSKQVHGEDVTFRYLSKHETDKSLIEYRIEALAEGIRVVIPMEVYQKGKLLFSGKTPGTLDDKNQFLTFRVKGGIQLQWRDSQSKRKKLELKGDQAIQTVRVTY